MVLNIGKLNSFLNLSRPWHQFGRNNVNSFTLLNKGTAIA